MSYKTQIKVFSDPKFYGNGVAFATEAEAKAYGENKLYNWTLAVEYKVVESDEPVNYCWDAAKGLVAVGEVRVCQG